MPKTTTGRNTSIIRILTVYKIIANEKNRGASIKEILEKVDTECSERTIRRDVDVLSNLFPIEEIKEDNISYYKFSEKQKEVSIPMTNSEILSLFVAQKIIENYYGFEIYNSFNSLINKIEKSFPLSLIRFFKALPKYIITNEKFINKDLEQKGFVGEIQNAILAKNKIEFEYISGFKNEKTNRIVDPYLIWLSEGMIYLISFCNLRNDFRSFLINRMSKLKVLSVTFEENKSFNKDEYTSSGIGVYGGKTQKVLLKFSDFYFDFVKQRKFHKSQDCYKKNGLNFMSLNVAITPELENLILGFGEHCEVIEPIDLREDIKSRISKMREIYYQKHFQAA